MICKQIQEYVDACRIYVVIAWFLQVKGFAHEKLVKTLITKKWKRFGRRMYLMYTVLPYAVMLASKSGMSFLHPNLMAI